MNIAMYEKNVKENTPSIFTHKISGSNSLLVYCVSCPDEIKDFFSCLDMWIPNGRIPGDDLNAVVYKIPLSYESFMSGGAMKTMANQWGVALYLDSGVSNCKNISVEKTQDNSKKPVLSETEVLLNEVIALNNNTPDGQIQDADTILLDIIEELEKNTDISDLSGFANEVFTIWTESADKKAVESLFELFTGISFVDYLKRCKENITKKSEGDDSVSADAIYEKLVQIFPKEVAYSLAHSVKETIERNRASEEEIIFSPSALGPVFLKKINE